MCRSSTSPPAEFAGLCTVPFALVVPLNAPYKLSATSVCARASPAPPIAVSTAINRNLFNLNLRMKPPMNSFEWINGDLSVNRKKDHSTKIEPNPPLDAPFE
jgi:hypothetical protein